MVAAPRKSSMVKRPAEPAPDEVGARRILLDQGLVLLDELLAQKEGA